ncbi:MULTISPECIES: formylmethanofuran dehydrogenase subunit C [Methylobacterium]|jgi:formylmethanofuran dehydrogenase subunit C|uniref:Formylmethanofuran dehydrogenase n=2 Tax=Methylobacterium TaxID=407 RepID=A0A0C6FHA7_9HYPH|nr:MULTISPECIES: formylmethanofuran dehydrogenase subunit C [Methylobacterium]MBZ6413656.1 formylmethanofuran dehydrogenase subunit C [Methylobacterium sp.]MBK3395243.1 formylmethanofuran dehydrogenase subunit C [Methylobacterium ajmalii]MBK3408920.1 formylmethanofuran dehydrogenase subunit C [Methylobacterium ajmalii]SFF41530.1 formylmethanofuran dehydrogenase, subunit C [Methylobacterium sp. yr596]BAQ46417.1 formylmethanofuran dehydrogenase [Methylobacterium aquaticum]
MTTLTLRAAPPERLDLAGLTPAALAGLSDGEAARLAVGTSRHALALGDCFAITLDGSDELRIVGATERLDRIGAGLAAGRIVVEGDVGQRLGAGMTGGTITVSGSAGPFAGTAARGGTIRIAGDAAESAGGAIHGAPAGLDGATLLIGGRAGDRLGDRMRAGLIVVREAGDHAASRMIAGTIVAEAVGDHPGYGMRRGTLVAARHGALLPTFVETGRQDLVVLRLLAKSIATHAPWAAALLRGPMRRYGGDLATLGKGELFTPVG